jgi:hypothetical protein
LNETQDKNEAEKIAKELKNHYTKELINLVNSSISQSPSKTFHTPVTTNLQTQKRPHGAKKAKESIRNFLNFFLKAFLVVC